MTTKAAEKRTRMWKVYAMGAAQEAGVIAIDSARYSQVRRKAKSELRFRGIQEGKAVYMPELSEGAYIQFSDGDRTVEIVAERDFDIESMASEFGLPRVLVRDS